MQENPTPIPVPDAGARRTPSGPPASLWSALSWVRDLAFSVLIAVVLIVFIYQPVKVEGTSMMPTLTDQERIFINKFTYRFGLGNIERGDTVVFWFPLDTSKSYIKRVIGLPGDTRRGSTPARSTSTGTPLDEDYVPEDYHDRVSYEEHRSAGRPVLRAGRSSQFLQRQPHLGLRQARRHLRKSRIRLLAPEKHGPPALEPEKTVSRKGAKGRKE